MEKVYNKLVRDKIPQIILEDGRQPITRILPDDEYKSMLEKKVFEEYDEFLRAKDRDERLEELADMVELIAHLANPEGGSLEGVIQLAENKKAVRGGFEQKIFLEKVEER